MQRNVVLGNKFSSRAASDNKARAAEFFWNYNTCESVLLCSCVLVAAMGVMFESQYLSSGSVQMESLAYITLITIGGSSFYYMIVCWTEIVGALVPALACNLLTSSVEVCAGNTAGLHPAPNPISPHKILCAAGDVHKSF